MTGTQKAKRAPKVAFEVTQEHIDTAVPRDSGHCMIADAIKEAYPHAEYVSVDLATIRFTDKMAGWRYIYLTPRLAQEALLAFDAGDKPEPFRVQNLRAAQMVPTGAARRRNPNTRTEAVLQKDTESGTGNGAVPMKVGGKTPPIGPSAGGAVTGKAAAKVANTGRRREFGLRGFIR